MKYISKIEGGNIFVTDTSEGSEIGYTEGEIFELAKNQRKFYGVNVDKRLIYPLMLVKKKKNPDMSCLGYMGNYSPTKIKYGFGVDYSDLGYSTHCEHKAQIHSREYLYWLEKDKLCSEMATLFFPFRQEAPIENDVFLKPFNIIRRDGSKEEIKPEEVAFTREKSLKGFPLDLIARSENVIRAFEENPEDSYHRFYTYYGCEVAYERMGLLRNEPCESVYKYGEILANKDKIGHIKLKTFGIKVFEENGNEFYIRRFPLQLIYTHTGLVFKEVFGSIKRYMVDSIIKAYQVTKKLKFECLNGNFEIDVNAYEDWKEVVLGCDKNTQAKRNLLGLGDYKMTPEGALLWLESGRGGKYNIPKNCKELKPRCIKFRDGNFELEINENITKCAVNAIEIDKYRTKLKIIFNNARYDVVFTILAKLKAYDSSISFEFTGDISESFAAGLVTRYFYFGSLIGHGGDFAENCRGRILKTGNTTQYCFNVNKYEPLQDDYGLISEGKWVEIGKVLDREAVRGRRGYSTRDVAINWQHDMGGIAKKYSEIGGNL